MPAQNPNTNNDNDDETRSQPVANRLYGTAKYIHGHFSIITLRSKVDLGDFRAGVSSFKEHIGYNVLTSW